MAKPRYITVEDAAREILVTGQTIRNYIRDGLFKSKFVGNRYLIDYADFMDFVDSTDVVEDDDNGDDYEDE